MNLKANIQGHNTQALKLGGKLHSHQVQIQQVKHDSSDNQKFLPRKSEAKKHLALKHR